ncbi:hypothetical protein ABZ654_39850 [Streptomyces hygroscopicus]|uniref:Uncharacterized protein n=1 Tax=Streptomyces demainii TaxID=588122 RepID=A0ABT9KRV3_9ACTN|nr:MULTISPECIES: hypothetical protein [Streptomyces]MCO8307875.1 hypothetical protein [Streptomyces sp. RKCA744]MDP9611174.1 hypothetical protein [Streptomyces demainii]
MGTLVRHVHGVLARGFSSAGVTATAAAGGFSMAIFDSPRLAIRSDVLEPA